MRNKKAWIFWESRRKYWDYSVISLCVYGNPGTKEALARKKSEGVHLGRPKGRKSARVKLTGKDDIIRYCLEAGFSKSAIARKLHVHRITLGKYIISAQIDTQASSHSKTPHCKCR